MRLEFGRKVVLAALASSALLVAGCATETPYRPATGSGFSRTGFSEQQVAPDRFLVSFAGNSVTSRDTVERYLLFRAAELTVQRGYDYFVTVQRDTDRQQRIYSTPSFGGGFGYGGFGRFGGGFWGPSWRFHRAGFGWGFYDPFFGGPFLGGNDIQSVDRFEATAEVVMRRGPIPQSEIRAFDARAVMSTIGPNVVLPGQQRRR
jgi:hypothetical protein